MRLKKGAIIVEFSLLSFVILSVSLFFWGLNSNIQKHQILDMLIYNSIKDIKNEIYLYSKIEENVNLSVIMDVFVKKMEDSMGISIDQSAIKNTISKNTLDFMILNKIKKRWSQRSNIDLRKAFRLKDYPKIKTSTKSGNLVVEAYLNFQLFNISDLFQNYTSCIRYEVGCRNIDRILSDSESAEIGRKSDYVFITQNGIDHTKVFHINSNCFGLRTAQNVIQVHTKIEDNRINYGDEKLNLCFFCRMGMKHDK